MIGSISSLFFYEDLTMGLFSKKRRVSTAIQTLSLIENTPDIIQQSVITSLLSSTDITTDLQNNMLSLFKDKVKRYYKYGRDHFTNGLPEGYMGGLAVDVTKLRPVLESVTPPVEDGSLIITSSVLDQAYYEVFMAKAYLRANTDWDPITNKLGLGNPFLPDWEIYFYPEKTKLTDNGTKLELYFHINPTVDESTIPPPQYLIHKVTPAYVQDPLKSYYYVNYLSVDVDENPVVPEYYWVYMEGAGTYPDLDIGASISITNQYMPIVPLRIEYKSYTDSSLAGTPLYDTSKKLLSKIDLKIKELDEGVNGNPDIEQIAHAYIVLGIDIKQDTPEVNQYLFSFFDTLVMSSRYTKQTFDEWNGSTNVTYGIPTPPTNIMSISDGTYRTDLNYYYVDKTTILGSFGEVGSYRKFINADHEMIEVPNQYDYESPDNTVIIDYQISATRYQRLIIAGISQTIGMYNAKDHIISLTSDENEVILVPLNNDLLDKMKPMVANTLAYQSLKIVFHAYQVTYTKWYQSGFFQFVTIVIAVVITVYTGGAGSFVSSLTAAAAAGVAALAIFIGQSVLIALAASVAFKFVAKKIGIEAASILAMVAMMYGLIGSDYAFELPYADSILSTVGPMFSAIQEVTGEAIEVIMNEYTEFMAAYEDKQKELAEMWKELQPPSRLDPLNIFTAVDMPAFESPEQYISRKTTTNISDFVGYNAIESFFDNALNLQPL